MQNLNEKGPLFLIVSLSCLGNHGCNIVINTEGKNNNESITIGLLKTWGVKILMQTCNKPIKNELHNC